jgi:hypothetical protein
MENLVRKSTPMVKTGRLVRLKQQYKQLSRTNKPQSKQAKKKSTLNFPDGLPIKQESDIDDGEGFWV